MNPDGKKAMAELLTAAVLGAFFATFAVGVAFLNDCTLGHIAVPAIWPRVLGVLFTASTWDQVK